MLRCVFRSFRILPKLPKLARASPCLASSSSHREYSSDAAKYEKKSPTEHVLLRPDTYIGGVGTREHDTCWVMHQSSGTMVPKSLCYPPGLIKIFDEILVNAADNKIRDPSMNLLRVVLDRKTSKISVWNNGKGLPVEIHPTEGIYVPTMVFGSLFTSSNYNDNEIKIVGGRNGYGAKLCNIFSKEFVVETVDSSRKRKFKQRWHNNMRDCDEAIVENLRGEDLADFTKVEFVPDLKRFHIDTISEDVVELIKKRVGEVAATIPAGVKVLFNDEEIQVTSFESYVKSFIPSQNPSPILFLHPTDRWHVGVMKRRIDEDRLLPNSISFVNNINTEKGGTHVEYVIDKIVAGIKKEIDSKLREIDPRKGGVKPLMIKNSISVFVNCLIENPSFESQTKETLTTKPKFFGSSFEFESKKVLQWAHDSELIADIIDEMMNLKKTKRKSQKAEETDLRDLVKLEDAVWANCPEKSHHCTLIVTEGDSAKALALAGLEILGRERYGVFPLKGKLINVSNLDEKGALGNAEISNMMRILGLRFGHQSTLRYGRLMVLADQDEDGSHIKGLVINFIHRFWPQLLRKGFVYSFRTPLLKARKGKIVRSFFSNIEYRKWLESTEDSSKYTIKYYKGLGTSTSTEAREYFSDLPRHIVEFQYNNADDDEAIEMAFGRDRAEDRKSWIRGHDYSEELEIRDETAISYKEFVDGELMRFGIVDLRRSIPCLVDGLKPSQRKILWTLLNMDEKEIKVSQLAGAVAHRQSYHHGEESLVRTIIRMGQKFCGASNLALLEPIGQFGTRHEAGQDAASARYIYTGLASTTRALYPAADFPLLERRIEDGMIVEPVWLCPIIPMTLVNGAEGIGTGWSTRIANRNQFQILDLIRRMIDSDRIDCEKLIPFYEDFFGRIEMTNGKQFSTCGNIQIIRPDRKNSTTFSLEINELPVGIWTSKYKEKLGNILDQIPNLGISEHHTEKRVKFRIKFDRKRVGNELIGKRNEELLRMFKLKSTITENLVLFDANGKLIEFENILDIARNYFAIRKRMYRKRLEMARNDGERKLKYAENQTRFVESVISGDVDLRGMNREILERRLSEMRFDSDPTRRVEKETPDYSYLLEMPLSRLTPDEMGKLREKRNRRRIEYEHIVNSRWNDTWHQELDKLSIAMRKTRE